MKRCVIIAASPQFDLTEEEYTYNPLEDYVIAADGGYRYALNMGIVPQAFLGDFDSYTGPIGQETEIHSFAKRKDDTDTGLAVQLALEKGYREILMLGAMGGRLDHTYANLQLLAAMAEQGVHGLLLARGQAFTMLKNGHMVLTPEKHRGFSIFSYTEVCRGVTLLGASYPLQNATLTHTNPLGISNYIEGDRAEIWVEDGALLIGRYQL